MKADVSSAWAGLLDPDEEIVWQGRPVARLVFRPADLAISGFGFIFFAFAVFWVAMASSMTSGTGPFGWFFPLFGIPFIFVGAFLLFGRFFWDAFRRGRTWYTLTDRRAFIATDIFGHKTLRDYTIEPDAEITLTEEGDEQSIVFAERWQLGVKGRSHRKTIGFELLPDGREVYAQMRAIREKARDGRRESTV